MVKKNKTKEKKMLDNCFYDKTKLIYKLSKAAWFIDKHAKENAKKAKDKECVKALEKLQKELEKQIAMLKEMLLEC